MIPQLLTLTIAVGTGGAVVQVLRETDGAFSLLGRPVDISEKFSALGSVGDIAFCAPSQYILGMRSQVELDKSGHVGFANDSSAYRARLRVDGQPA